MTARPQNSDVRLRPTRSSGHSLIEVLVAIGVFVLTISALGFLVLDADIVSRESNERLQAIYLAEEGVEASRSLRDEDYANLVNGDHGLALSGGVWTYAGTSDTQDQFTRVVTVETVNQVRKKIISEVTWALSPIRTGNIRMVTYLANFYSIFWIQTAASEFNAGLKNSVEVTTTADGEVQLVGLGDWGTAVSQFNFDNTGNGNATSIYTTDERMYLTTLNTAGSEFVVLDIRDISDGVMPQLGSVEIGGDVFSVAVSGGYAYLATGLNGAELTVIRLSDFSNVNSYNIPSGSDAFDVAVSGSVAYVVTANSGSEEFYALDISDPEGTITELGSVEIADDARGVAVSGGYAYLATDLNAGELTVIRLSDYTNVNAYDAAGNQNMSGIAIDGTTAYLTRFNSGSPELYGIDISSPEGTLILLGSYDAGDDARAVSVAPDGNVYLATDNNAKEFIVVNTSTYTELASADIPTGSNAYAVAAQGAYAYVGTTNNPEVTVLKGGGGGWESPTQVGVYDGVNTIDAYAVYVDGNYAYLGTLTNAGANPEFYIVDISTPASPSISGFLNVGADVRHIHISGNYAYLATSDDARELVVVNIANKAAPFQAGTYNADEGRDGYSVFVAGTTVYLGTANNGGAGDHEFYILDASVPSSITLLGSYDILSSVWDIEVSGDRAYLATGNNTKEFIVLNVADPALIYEEDSYNTTGTVDAYGVAKVGDIAYFVGSNDAGNPDMFILDVTPPVGGPTDDWTTPILAGLYDSDEGINANDVYIDGNYAYMGTENNTGAGDHEFYIIDITDPQNPVLSGSVEVSSAVNKVYVAGNYAYLATDHNSKELFIVDISNKAAPFEAGSYNSDEGANGLAVFAVGSTAYLGTANNNGGGDNEFYILDVSSPSSVSLLGTVEAGSNIYDIVVNGNYAYVATGNNGAELGVIDISTPASPSVADTYNAPGGTDAMSVFYDAPYVYLGRDSASDDFYIIDATTPTNVSVTGSLSLGSNNMGIYVSGNRAYVSTETNNQALKIIDITNKAFPVQTAVYNAASDANGVSFDGSYVYLATEHNTQELQVVGPNKTVTPYIALLGSLDLNSTNRSIVVDGSTAYVGTDTGGAELTLVDVASSTAPTESVTFNAGGDVNSVHFDGTYAYLATENDTAELQIIGPSSVPPDLSREGWFISSAFDSGSALTVWDKISWTATGTGSVSLQLRTATTSAELDAATWVGPTGTASSFYTVSDTSIVTDTGASGVQWIQYKVYFVGNGSSTPVLEDIKLSYN